MVGNNLSGLLKKSLGPDQLNLLQRVAGQAAALHVPAFLVGGPVRDLLMDRAITDLDVVVEGDAIRLARALVKAHGGKAAAHPKFGTARWSTDQTGLDLISARSEQYEQPGALPKVTFSNIEADLRRRDFTINAMALRLEQDHFGELLDPLGGRGDLDRGMIRVLHPRSFLDDPTRMLRAVRYERRYAFAIHAETLELVNADSRSVLGSLSGERLRHELDLIFEESDPSAILARLAELGLLAPVHPGLATLTRPLPSLAEPPVEWGEFKTAEILTLRQTLGWICWLIDAPVAELESIAERLAFPAALTKAARAAASLYAELPALAGSRPSEWTNHLDSHPALAAYAVYVRTQTPELQMYLSKWRHIRSQTTGDDLKARGLPPGPEYRRILTRLRAAWVDNEILTFKDETDLLDKILKGAQ